MLNRVGQLICAGLASSLALLIFLAVFGAYFPETLTTFHLEWLYNPERGVYADCSKAANRNVGFCRPKNERIMDEVRYSGTDKGKAMPFNLYDRD